MPEAAPHEMANRAERDAGLAPTPGYRYADVVGDQLFVAGQVPFDARGSIPSTAADEQAELCLDNLSTLLGVHGFQESDIRHLTVYVVGDREVLVEAWGGVLDWWGDVVPPATLLGVNTLGHEGQIVEIDAVIRHSDALKST